jgi:hypothetical protein
MGLVSVAVFFELFFNQVIIPKRTCIFQVGFCIFYMVITMLMSTTNSPPIYKGLIEFECSTTDCLWPEYFLFHMTFLGVTQACFWVMVGIHFFKAKYICKKSVQINTQPLIADSHISSLGAKQK